MPASTTIKVGVRSPIWTGGVDGATDSIHATGLIGGLRWWYEAILRGLGNTVCDYRRSPCQGLQVCAACSMFGATGYRRRFTLRVQGQTVEPAWPGKQPINLRPPDRTRGWFLGPGMTGTFSVFLTASPSDQAELVSLLRFLERWGTLGAKPQLGYGAFSLSGLPADSARWEAASQAGQNPPGLPDLRRFAFFCFRFVPPSGEWWRQVPGIRQFCAAPERRALMDKLGGNGMVPVAPALRNFLRYDQREWSSQDIPHWLFGTLHGNTRVRSKLGMGWATRDGQEWEVKGWVSVPQDRIGSRYLPEIVAVLKTLESPETWSQALGLRPAKARVVTAFQPRPWDLHTSVQVATLLNEQVTHD
jgi:CRISPR-associated protein Cmr1